MKDNEMAKYTPPCELKGAKAFNMLKTPFPETKNKYTIIYRNMLYNYVREFAGNTQLNPAAIAKWFKNFDKKVESARKNDHYAKRWLPIFQIMEAAMVQTLNDIIVLNKQQIKTLKIQTEEFEKIIAQNKKEHEEKKQLKIYKNQ